MQSQVRVTPGEIKTKTPRIPRIARICQQILDQAPRPPVRYVGTKSLQFNRIIRQAF